MAKGSLSSINLELEVMISMLNDIRESKPIEPRSLTRSIENFLGDLNSQDRYETLIQSGILETFVKLYYTHATRKEGGDYILHLLQLITASHLTSCLEDRASVVFQLCLCMIDLKLSPRDQVYSQTLGRFRELVEKGNCVLHFKCEMGTISNISLIFRDLTYRMELDLDWSTNSPSSNDNAPAFFNDLRDYKAISHLLCYAIRDQEVNPIPFSERNCDGISICCLYTQLMLKMGRKLESLRHEYMEEGRINEEKVRPEWSLYLPLLEEMNFISKLHEDDEKHFWELLKKKKDCIRALILRFADGTEGYDYEWLLEHNDVTDSQSRMHLALLMIPEVKQPEMESVQKLVDWSQDLFGVFENKKVGDPQVLEDWLCKSSKAIFNKRRNPLFLECQDDPTRFSMNHEFKAEPFHYDSAEFAGKVIALALIYKVKIGVALDHVFLLKLKEQEDYSSLESFFAKGFAEVFGVSLKELLSFKGLEIEDINKVLHRPHRTHCGTEDTNGNGMREADVDPLLLQYKRVRKDGRNIKNWQKGSKLGSGSYGEVYQGLADGGFFFAAKQVPLIDAAKVSSIEKEIDLLCQFNHENIVEYFGTKQEGTDLYIFLEYVSGSSLDKVQKEFILDDFQVSRYTKQILEGLKYLHQRNVMHGDIKCANVLLDEDGSVKIADFGLATTMGLRSLRKSGGGSSVWSAPEVINMEKQGYGLEADIWSLGCTVLEMFNREYPNSFPSTIHHALSTDARDFIQKCLQVKPEERPTVAQLLQHPFVKW